MDLIESSRVAAAAPLGSAAAVAVRHAAACRIASIECVLSALSSSYGSLPTLFYI